MSFATTMNTATFTNVAPSLKWSVESAQKAGANNKFIRVNADAKTVAKRYMSGAERSWNGAEEADTIFNTRYRITGNEQDVREALTLANIAPEEIETVIRDSITRDNFATSKAAEYQEEIARHVDEKKNKPATVGFTDEEIKWFVDNIKTAVLVSKDGKKSVASAASPRRAGGQTLGEKLASLSEDKVLDVSNMTPDGKGTRTTTYPKSGRSGKVSVDGIKLLSNNLDKYRQALVMAYGPDATTTYAAQLQHVQVLLENNARVKTVAKPVARSPTTAFPGTVPGAALAPRPNAFPATVRTPTRPGVKTMGAPSRFP